MLRFTGFHFVVALATMISLSPCAALGYQADPPIEQAIDGPVVDIQSALALEARVKLAHARSLPTSVGVEIMDSLMPVSSGSGTIISKDGWILTAGHVCGLPDQDVTIHFCDGRTVKGKTVGLHWDGMQDCGVVRFDPSGIDFESAQIKVAELGSMEGVEIGDWVIALGHTFGIEKDPFRPPVLRLGRVTGLSDSVINMDAPLSSGDSGGGVFDLDGRLIGINASAGPEPDLNSATTIDFAKIHLSDMQQKAATGKNADEEREAKGRKAASKQLEMKIPARNGPRKGESQITKGIAPVVDNAILMTVEVFVDGRLVGFGTVADENGFILAKASDVGMTSANLMIALPDGLTVGGRRMAVDPDLDLVLIATDEAMDAPMFAVDVSPAVGSLLVTVGRDGFPAALGVRSLDEYRPGRSDVTASYLGLRVRPITPEERTEHGERNGVIVMMVSASSPAARAGLAVGDFVTTIGGKLIQNQPELGEEVRRHAAGEIIEIIRIKEDREEKLRARLGSRPNSHGPSPSTPHFPASRRSSGFGPVIQHDTALRADQIGGPIVDLDGNIVGINIARADRTKSYALSAAVVKGAIDRLMAQAKERTEPLPLIDPLNTGMVIREEKSVTRLNANTAEIIGTRLRFAQKVDTLGALELWIDANDSARWLVEFTTPGEYSVTVFQSCLEEHAGQDFAVQLGATQLPGKTRATADLSDFEAVDIGSIHVETPGRAIIEIKTGGRLKGPLMNLHAIELKRKS